MNVFKALCLPAVVWLAGCATGPLPLPSDNTATNEAKPTVTAAPSAQSPTPAPPAAATPHNNTPPNTTPLSQIAEQQTASRGVAPLAPPADIWERIRRGYAMKDLDTDLVRDREQWYANRPDYIFRMTERSKKYLFYIVEELEVRNMPSELALLPFI